mmetsp:Transcript_5028/g.10975  ORF Transcript_5028/g.10975 Transcript_5028/m.10975 type:complete len:833 (+) Transcript_5028:111-2609(+)|eukprot:CAMPEP_0183724408 /NCGR_PEP_ID=MMETSP0737-20130205/17911_1 /TAXON_ID=385413 /ORGANISM="Thalassiosira miniscula, Strain CCMP1093" /LENGTH=832 /DNA_ID=CAMNT_0025954987 /DNA_START=71 /DNA_END=2569 /DNA_ORIENTATION=+
MTGEDPEVLAEPTEEPPEVVKLVEEAHDDYADEDPKSLKENDGEETATKVFPMREVCVGPLRFNWLVSILGLGVLWGVSIYCMTNPEASAELGKWYDTTILYFTWFYILGNPVMTFFIFWVAYRYGHIKLGPKDAEPEFSDVSYFAMLFSAGVGVGLFFFGVSEPLTHATASNYITAPGYHNQNEVDQWALNITMYHWGFAGWSPYLCMAICAGLASYRFGLPLTIRSSFYPILGDYCWGWMGDMIDAWSIVMTVAGVCTSLGLGTMQLAAGIIRLGWVDPTTNMTNIYVAIIWIITAFATLSVVSGLKLGIKILSVVGFGLGCLILFLSFVMEKSYWLLNVLVQTTGVYLQWNIFQLPFWTNAFGGLKEGEGRATDEKSAPWEWMGWWTVFYMAWWVAWACFVGLFIARISKNRSLRNVVFGVFLAPTAYALVWMSFMGGMGLRQQRQANELQELGRSVYNDEARFETSYSEFCYDVPQEDVEFNGATVFVNTLPGITPVCRQDPDDKTNDWFNIMYSFSYPGTGANGDFGGFGQFMSGISIFTLAIYFITSSDSGSLVVDTLASNGAEEHHWIQRVFWALTEGAVATGLLVAGGNNALGALQTASIVFGLPFNFFIFFMCWSIQKMCEKLEQLEELGATGIIDAKLLLPKKTWEMPIFGGIFNIVEFIVSFGMVNKQLGIEFPTSKQVVGFFKNLLLPFLPLYSICSSIDMKGENARANMLLTVAYALCHVGWIALFICGTINYGFVAFGWSAFFLNACILTSVRMHVRGKLGIVGNFVGDFIAGSFLYPQALLQIELQLEHEDYSFGDGNPSEENEDVTVPLHKHGHAE